MFQCIYCLKSKNDCDSTLEHVIPQSLGGASAPDIFKTRRACKTCNSNLGLFVDAGFEKSWIISNWLQLSAMACFDPRAPTSLPLIYMGLSTLNPPHMLSDEVCEAYLGPLGEQIYLIRPADDKFYWYAGGNPRTLKNGMSRAYYIFSDRSERNERLTFLSLRDSFKGKNVRKISCSKINGIAPEIMGFTEPDDIDLDTIAYLWEQGVNRTKQVRHSFNFEFDTRFIAKIARGIAFCLFGEKALTGDYSDEITKALWYKAGDDTAMLGQGFLVSSTNPAFSNHMGIDHAITFLITLVSKNVVININLGRRHNASVKCLDLEVLNGHDISTIGHGIVIVTFPHLAKSFQMTLPEFINHKSHSPHDGLKQIEENIRANANYFSTL